MDANENIQNAKSPSTKKIQYEEKMSIYTKLIWGVVVLWPISLAATFLITDKYVNNKDNELYRQICEQIDSVFKNRDSYIDVAYSGNKVEYSSMKIPTKPANSNNKQLADIRRRVLKDWQNDYGDLFKMYHIKWSSEEWENPWDRSDGWNLMELRKNYSSDGKLQIYACWYFPYAVGYRRQDYAWDYDYIPSIQQAVDDAFEFFTTNSKSNFIENFEKGSIDRVFASIKSNQYYFLKKNTNPNFWSAGISIVDGNPDHTPIRATYMYNGYYKVFVAKSLYTAWTVTKWNENIAEKERIELNKKWGAELSFCVVVCLIILLVIRAKYNKLQNENLRKKLIRLCSPQQYMHPYNKEKVDIANQLYQELNSIDESKEEELIDFADKACRLLQFSIIDSDKLAQLKELVNPSKFLTPYNAEKVNLANELYAKLNESSLSLSTFNEVESKAQELLRE